MELHKCPDKYCWTKSTTIIFLPKYLVCLHSHLNYHGVQASILFIFNKHICTLLTIWHARTIVLDGVVLYKFNHLMVLITYKLLLFATLIILLQKIQNLLDFNRIEELEASYPDCENIIECSVDEIPLFLFFIRRFLSTLHSIMFL